MMRPIAYLVLLLMLSACSNAGFYLQAVSGHMDLLSRRQPVVELLEDPGLDDALRQRLLLAQSARAFASTDLGLPDNASYTSYADLQRPFVTWNVVAAREFSVDARTWCYLHAVCLPYRGYFAAEAAREYADGLAAEGYDVHVYGVAAYSTSGWFDDPLLNTMMRMGDERMVALIFHELAHQQLFLKRDGGFSEAFATFVEQEGMRRWLSRHGDAQALTRFSVRQARRLQFLALLRKTRAALEAVFASPSAPADMRVDKAQVFANLRAEYQVLKQEWAGYAGYDAWFAAPINNARLVSVATYNDRVPAFATLLSDNDHDLARFYSAAKAISDLPGIERARRLDELAGRRGGAD